MTTYETPLISIRVIIINFIYHLLNLMNIELVKCCYGHLSVSLLVSEQPELLLQIKRTYQVGLYTQSSPRLNMLSKNPTPISPPSI